MKNKHVSANNLAAFFKASLSSPILKFLTARYNLTVHYSALFLPKPFVDISNTQQFHHTECINGYEELLLCSEKLLPMLMSSGIHTDTTVEIPLKRVLNRLGNSQETIHIKRVSDTSYICYVTIVNDSV